MQPSNATISDTLNALYCCTEIGFDDYSVLLDASKLLIMLTSFDPSAFLDSEYIFITAQLREAETAAHDYHFPNLDSHTEGF